MGQATPLAIRKEIVSLRQPGKQHAEISQELNVPFATVKYIWGNYKREGEKGLLTKYANCGVKTIANLGNEINFLLNYNMNKFTNLELGYSVMMATDSMPFAKEQATTDAAATNFNKTGTWSYFMVDIRPDFFYKKIQFEFTILFIYVSYGNYVVSVPQDNYVIATKNPKFQLRVMHLNKMAVVVRYKIIYG